MKIIFQTLKELVGKLNRIIHPTLNRVLLMSGINVEDPQIVSLLSQLQTIHDSCPPENWEAELSRLETNNGYR